jgi:hypothetical protein
MDVDWKKNIKINVRETGRGSVDRINLAQDRDLWLALVSTVMNILIP